MLKTNFENHLPNLLIAFDFLEITDIYYGVN